MAELTKLIPISKGKHVIVDADDYNWLVQKKWFFSGRYAGRREGTKTIYMHKLILATPKGLVSDHIDGDGLNNRRSNLRICTRAENLKNKANYKKKKTSKFKGVSWQRKPGKWSSRIMVNGKRIYLGGFDSEEKAAAIYREAEIKYYGEFARKVVK